VLAASALVLATPPRAAASLLDGVSPSVATSLRAIRTSSVVLVTFAYGYVPLEGSGFLVPRSEHRLMTACTFVDNKWPHLRRPGITILRASAGRVDDDRAMHMDDESLVSRLHAEISLALGVRTPPLETRVHRWVDAFPQYEVGHLDRVAAMEAQLARDAPGVALAGAALRGVGIATCIAGGREAARRVTSPIGPLRE
jgi:oxygen-dependent protoporphyrinogen oxidase